MLLSEHDNAEMIKGMGERILIDGRPTFGIFDTALEELDFDRSIESESFTLTITDEDAEFTERGSVVTVRGQEFIVATIQDDMEGMHVARLTAQ